MTGISPGWVSNQLKAHMDRTGKVLPTRGIVEDCSPAVTHKAIIIERHLKPAIPDFPVRRFKHSPAGQADQQFWDRIRY